MKLPLPNTVLLFMWHFLKPYKAIGALFVFLGVMAGFWGPLNSMLVKYIINILPELSHQNLSLLKWPGILIVLNFLIFDNLTWRSIGYLNYAYQAPIKNEIIRTTLDSVLRHSHQYFQEHLSGKISNQITALADNVELILHRLLPDFIRGISLMLVVFATAYSVNPLFFYTLLVWFIGFAAFSICMSNRLVALANGYARTESTVSGQLVDSISNQMNIRIFSKRDYEISRNDQFLAAREKAFKAKEMFIVGLCIVQGLLIAIMMGFSVYFLTYLYGKGLVSIGDFALILGISMELGHMMWYTMSRVDEFNQAVGKCKQSLEALITPLEITDKPHAKELNVTKGQITFEEVKFHYKGASPLFQDKSVTIKAGQRVGLVGYSGSGKTTFVNLILRLYNVTSGRILIDGQDICECSQESLRASIATISQDPSLFHRSILDNIRYGRIDASDEEVIEAAKKAHAHEFIINMPQGYDSLVGERGVKVSGGQRQRLAIARAILKDSPILILDEATSQLDSVTENHIQESLLGLMEKKTTIVIAHRLSTLLQMDRIIVFDQGKIVEDGTHEELLENQGLYKTLWETQVGGFLPDESDDR